MRHTTVYVSKECIRLLRSISPPEHFISQIGVFRAGNCKQASSSIFKKKHNIWNKAFQPLKRMRASNGPTTYKRTLEKGPPPVFSDWPHVPQP